MIGLESLRWLLTLVFAAATAFHLARVPRAGVTAEQRVSEALHLLMCGSMIVMIWPWGNAVPPAWWISGFALSTGWFAAHAVQSAGRRVAPVFFATATAAMVWTSAAPGGHLTMPGMRHEPGGYPAWINAALGGYLMLAALFWVVRGMRLSHLGTSQGADRPPHWPAVCHGVMSAGMGLALLSQS
jgi:hypothetical protein